MVVCLKELLLIDLPLLNFHSIYLCTRVKRVSAGNRHRREIWGD